jgi:peptide/nickel transport system substrate-binding protein
MSVSTRVRRSWTRLSAVFAGLVTAFAIGALGQPPAEVEDPKGGIKKRVPVEDDPVIVKPKGGDSGPGTPPDVKLDELFRGAEETAHPAIKDLYQKHVVPFDRLHTKGGFSRIKPIPVARGERLPLQFGIQELKRDGQFGEVQGVNASDVRKIEYFEEIALVESNIVLTYKPFGTAGGPEGWTAADQLGAAERVMAAALRFHDFARENPRERPIRKGRGWDELRKPLADRLREVRLLSLKNAVTVSDWPRVRETGSRLMLAYPKDAGVAAEVASARVLEAKRLLASEKHFDHVKARELLDEFEARYPGGGGEPVRAIRAELTALAQRAFTRAKDKKAVNDLTTARDALAQAAALDPTIPGLRDMQRELKAGYQTLYVGVRDYPVMLSPATARLDSEKQVVELVFEGLLAEVPDDGGGARYRPGVAATMPTVVPGGREFLLRSFERDASGRYGFESHDVIGTLKLMQTQTSTWTGYPLPWLDELPTPKDNTTIRVAFKQGHPDPRALLTFKLLPARWMTDNNKQIDDAAFAEKPSGTGPFKLQYSSKADGNTPREMVFVDNPLYGRWRDRANQPFIKEIRLIEATKVHNLVESFQQGSLHILTDVPTADLDKFTGPAANLSGKVQAYTATNNRRIHMLAINHRRPQMQSKALRQGLSLAIDRDAILSDVYRAGKTDVHKPLGGPFPPKCWATVKGSNGNPVPLVNRDLAVTKLQTYLGDMGAKPEVTLSYPEGDPQAALACNKIKAQVEALFKDTPGRKITILLEPVPLRDLLVRVEDEHRYDLAYVPFEYPDDWYPYALGAMLDPLAADRGGRNWMGFLQKNTGADDQDARLGQLLNELRAFRDFGTLATKTVEVHKLFNECVPFIPLWQLDRHMLVHNAVKVYTEDSDQPISPRVLNPTTLFQGIARWRLEG